MTKNEISAAATAVIDYGPTATEYWWIETTGPEGQDLAVAFTGSWADAKAAARLTPGACIHHVRDWTPPAGMLAA